jgi:hypothetical protein
VMAFGTLVVSDKGQETMSNPAFRDNESEVEGNAGNVDSVVSEWMDKTDRPWNPYNSTGR